MHTALILPLVTGLMIAPVPRLDLPKRAWPQGDTTTTSKHVPPLTMDLVRKIAAAKKTLDEQARANPEQAKKDSAVLDMGDKHTTVSLIVSHFRASSSPAQLATIKKAGLTPDEFVIGEMRLVIAMLVQPFRNAGVPVPTPGGAGSGMPMTVTGLPTE